MALKLEKVIRVAFEKTKIDAALKVFEEGLWERIVTRDKLLAEVKAAQSYFGDNSEKGRFCQALHNQLNAKEWQSRTDLRLQWLLSVIINITGWGRRSRSTEAIVHEYVSEYKWRHEPMLPSMVVLAAYETNTIEGALRVFEINAWDCTETQKDVRNFFVSALEDFGADSVQGIFCQRLISAIDARRPGTMSPGWFYSTILQITAWSNNPSGDGNAWANRHAAAAEAVVEAVTQSLRRISRMGHNPELNAFSGRGTSGLERACMAAASCGGTEVANVVVKTFTGRSIFDD